jgi:hypothetical protein
MTGKSIIVSCSLMAFLIVLIPAMRLMQQVYVHRNATNYISRFDPLPLCLIRDLLYEQQHV